MQYGKYKEATHAKVAIVSEGVFSSTFNLAQYGKVCQRLHSHANQTDVLDKLTASGDQLRFNGKQVGETRTWVRTTTELPATWPTDMHPDGVLFLIPTA